MKQLTTLKQLGVAIVIGIATLLILLLMITTLYYFNIVNSKTFTILELIVPIISVLISGITMGKQAKAKGWLSGLEVGLAYFIFFLLFAFLGLHHQFKIQNFIYYIAIIGSSTFGGMIGINYRKKDSF